MTNDSPSFGLVLSLELLQAVAMCRQAPLAGVGVAELQQRLETAEAAQRRSKESAAPCSHSGRVAEAL